MDMLEIGFYSAVTVYGLIAVWSVLVRLHWLPTALVRLVHRPLNRLGRVPILGRVVNICRRYSLSLGLLVATLIGVAVPYFVFSTLWVVQAIGVGVVLLFGAVMAFLGDDSEDNGMTPSPNRLYWSVYRDEVVYGWDTRADASRPWL